MLISVITPTFNSEKTIIRNIKSIIEQNYNNFEHIIIDNLSTDNTLEAADKIYHENKIRSKLKITSERDEGIADAFNKGIKSATGEIIAILNSDDYYFDENVFDKVMREFENSNIQFVHGDIYFKDEIYGSNIRKPLSALMMKGLIYNHPTMFVRKSFYEKIGLFNTDYKFSMDFEFYCRIAKNSKPDEISVYLKEKPLVQMTSGGASWNNELKSVEENEKALKLHGFWNKGGKNFIKNRRLNTNMKKYISKFRLFWVVKLWRKLKWGN
jgi:glycosyltransferase involved in cell wall biosynthesis